MMCNLQWIYFLYISPKNELHDENVSLDDSRARLVPILQARVLRRILRTKGEAEATARCQKARGKRAEEKKRLGSSSTENVAATTLFILLHPS